MEPCANETVFKEMKKLVDMILQSDLYQEYLGLKKKMLLNPELMEKINQLKKVQQSYVKSSFSKEYQEEIETLKADLEQYPLYVKYQEVVEELDSLCYLMREGFHGAFTNILEGK